MCNCVLSWTPFLDRTGTVMLLFLKLVIWSCNCMEIGLSNGFVTFWGVTTNQLDFQPISPLMHNKWLLLWTITRSEYSVDDSILSMKYFCMLIGGCINWSHQYAGYVLHYVSTEMNMAQIAKHECLGTACWVQLLNIVVAQSYYASKHFFGYCALVMASMSWCVSLLLYRYDSWLKNSATVWNVNQHDASMHVILWCTLFT